LDPIGEYAVAQLKEYEGYKLVSATKEGLCIEDTKEEHQRVEEKKSFENPCKVIKEILGDKVERVVVSDMILESPCVLVVGAIICLMDKYYSLFKINTVQIN